MNPHYVISHSVIFLAVPKNYDRVKKSLYRNLWIGMTLFLLMNIVALAANKIIYTFNYMSVYYVFAFVLKF